MVLTADRFAIALLAMAYVHYADQGLQFPDQYVLSRGIDGRNSSDIRVCGNALHRPQHGQRWQNSGDSEGDAG